MRDGDSCRQAQFVIVIGKEEELSFALERVVKIVTMVRADILPKQGIQVVGEPHVGNAIELHEECWSDSSVFAHASRKGGAAGELHYAGFEAADRSLSGHMDILEIAATSECDNFLAGYSVLRVE